MKRIVLFSIFAVACFGSLKSQSKVEEEWGAYFMKADAFMYSNSDSSLLYLDSADMVAQKYKTWELVVYTQMFKSTWASTHYKFAQSEKYLKEADKLLKKYNDYLVENDTIQDTYRFFLQTKGIYLYSMGSFQDALNVLLESIAMERKYDDPNGRLGYVLVLAAKCYVEMGRSDRANELISQARAIDNGKYGKVRINDFMSSMYLRDRNYRKSIDISKASVAALQTKVEYFDVQPIQKASMHLVEGYLGLGNPDSASYYLKLMKDSDNASEKLMDNVVLRQEGQIEMARKNYVVAADLFGKSYKSARKQYTGKHRDIAHILMLWGDAESGKKNPKAAIALYQKALSEISEDFSPGRKIMANPDPKGIRFKHQAVEILTKKANALFELYKMTGDKRYLGAAYQTIEFTVEVARLTYSELNNESAREDWSSRTVRLYEEGIIIAQEINKLYPGQASMELVFRYSELHKAGTLLEALNNTGAIKYAGVPDSLLRDEHRSKQQLGYIKREIFLEEEKGTSADQRALGELYRELAVLQKTCDDHAEYFRSNYPDYYRFRYNLPVVGIADIQQQIPDSKSATLEYFLGEKGLYCIIVTKNDAQLVTLPLGFEKNINELRNALTNNDLRLLDQTQVLQMFKTSAAALYDVLLKEPLSKLSKETNRLTIIPDGPLVLIPFEILLSDDANRGKNDFGGLPYLLRMYAVSYAASSTILLGQAQRQPSKAQQEFAGFAPEYDNALALRQDSFPMRRTFRRDNLRVLPGAIKEVSAIAAIMGGKMFLGKDATERNFKSNVNDYRIVHCSMHAMVESRNPMFSGLLFSVVPDSIEDNDLTAAEIYDMRLDNDMAVLSACNTGVGKEVRGEGITGLSRAFMYAGCLSTVMSLWEVSDENAGKLMSLFYERLKSGYPKDEALRMAKLQFLEESPALAQNPFIWSAFVASGDMRPVANGFPWIWVGLGVLGVLLLGAIVAMRRKGK